MTAWPAMRRALPTLDPALLDAFFGTHLATVLWRPEPAEVDACLARAAGAMADPALASDLNWYDLALADACVRGRPAALREFEALLERLRPMAAGLSPSSDELLQEVRTRLLLPPDAKLADFGGRSSLFHWLKATIVNVGLSQHRTARRTARVEELTALLPELPHAAEWVDTGLQRAETREQVRRALDIAMSRLTRSSRMLLRQHYLDQVTLDQLAAYHRVHRATVARWLAQARSALIGHLEAELDGKLSSVIAELHSRTSLSLHRLLAEEDAPT